jgi:outer membrane protein TolC
VAARETLRLLERSVRTQEELVEIGRALVTADELAAADLARLQARLASTRGLLSRTRQGLLQRRVALANAMGLTVEETADARPPRDLFPELPDRSVMRELGAEELARIALARRSDLRAARTLEESARVLNEAARADLKRQVDLSLTVAYSGLHEGGSVTRADDVFEGFRGALTDRYAGPSIQAVVDFDLPFRNLAARGRHVQTASLVRRSTIESVDLEREVRAQTGVLIASLDRAILECERRSEAVHEYERLLSSTLERFALGEATTTEIVLTEELGIQEEASLVAARQRCASLLAQLRFTVGALMTYKLEGGRLVPEELQPLGFDFSAPFHP